MTDFEEAGELGVFIDEEQLRGLEEKMDKHGFLEGREMATTFNMLRANDLIWSFVVNNYLLGQEPFPFDLLYWNDDSTRMPARMHSFYLRQHVPAERPGASPAAIDAARACKIDLRKIKVPSYLVSTREDHIAPWKSTYRATQIYAGPVRFVLAATGHIAGVVNPPESGKYSHWVTRSCRPTRMTGSLAPPSSPAPGGPTGSAGSTTQDKEQVEARVPGDGSWCRWRTRPAAM